MRRTRRGSLSPARVGPSRRLRNRMRSARLTRWLSSSCRDRCADSLLYHIRHPYLILSPRLVTSEVSDMFRWFIVVFALAAWVLVLGCVIFPPTKAPAAGHAGANASVAASE